MKDLGNVKVLYLSENDKKKSASGIGTDMGSYIKIDLKESLRRTKFNTVLIPWDRILKVIVLIE